MARKKTPAQTPALPTRKPSREELVALAMELAQNEIRRMRERHAKALADYMTRVASGDMYDILSAAQWNLNGLAELDGGLSGALFVENVLNNHSDLDHYEQLNRAITYITELLDDIVSRRAWINNSTNPVSNVIEAGRVNGKVEFLQSFRANLRHLLVEAAQAE